MNIVLGVDGSSAASKAVEWVAGSGRGQTGRVLVIAAIESGIAARDSELMRLEREAAEKYVSTATHALAGLGAKIEGKVVDGDPRQVLVDIASAERADLLVVGSHGRTGIARLLLGSVAAHVVEHAPCSVLVVRPSA